MNTVYDVIIIGSGPAGLTAAIYTTRGGLKTLVIAGVRWGGQLMLTNVVENFPGFPEGIMGPDLMLNMRKQAEHHGAEVIDVNFEEADFSVKNKPFELKAGGKVYEAKTVIIATGADTRWLNVKGEKELIGLGVSSCAPCDAAFFREKNVIVVGGGDSALEEAMFLTRFAKEVTVVHRKEGLRASHVMQEKAKKDPKIKFLFNSEIVEVLGKEKVKGVMFKDNKKGETNEMAIDGVFVAIGHRPNSAVFKGIETNDLGYIVSHNSSRTNIPRVFVAGDVHDYRYQQAITAAGFGCQAALEVQRWFEGQKI